MLMNPITQEKQKNEREVWECAVSWSWLLSFIKENETRLKNLSTQDVVNQIVIPATIDNKSRYVDLLPNSCVSLPTYFASHVWNAPFLDLVESLREHISDNVSEDVFVWLDIFAVNQHRDSGTQASDLKGLNIAVEKSNKTIVCIDTNAKLLTRIWCLFEIWHTFKLDVQRLAVVTRNTDVEQLKNIFITCDVAAAQATVLADRDRILEEIKKSMAFKKMNEDIKNALVDSARFEVQRVVNIYGENSVSIIRTLEKLVKMLSFVGKFDEAKPYAEKSLEICKNAYGLEHSETATSIYNLGALLDDMAKYAEAKTYYVESLEIRKRVLGSKHSDTATSLHNLGFLSNNMGKYEEAKSYYEESLKIRKELFDPKHPDIATSLHYFAVLLRHMKEYEKAKDYYGQSLAIRKEVFGAEHPSVATSLNNLGALLTDMKDYKEAKSCLEKALEIREKVFGEHSNTASTLNNLGTLFCDMKDYEKAKTYYLKSLAIWEKTGSEHAQTATALHNFATLLNNMGEYDEAKTYYQKALAIREKSLPSKHPDTIKTFDALTVLLNRIENN